MPSTTGVPTTGASTGTSTAGPTTGPTSLPVIGANATVLGATALFLNAFGGDLILFSRPTRRSRHAT